ncbi:MAG: hypothetical protein IJ715_03165 [Bacilli bacterium]|nr:hypothetical protein [Bacilli bacterium]
MKSKCSKIFLISGKAQAGKDTTAGFIKKNLELKGLKVINLQYSSYIKEYAKKISGWDGREETKPRELLQILGTDIIRKELGSDFFVKKLVEDIKVYSYFFDIITISDVRLKIEIDIPRNKFDNIYAIRIVRPNFDNGLSEEQKKHQTEIDLDDYDKFDYVLINDGTISDLDKKVSKMLEEVQHES